MGSACRRDEVAGEDDLVELAGADALDGLGDRMRVVGAGRPRRRRTPRPAGARVRLRQKASRAGSAAGRATRTSARSWPSRRPTMVDGTTSRAASAESSAKGNEPKQTSPVPGRRRPRRAPRRGPITDATRPPRRGSGRRRAPRTSARGPSRRGPRRGAPTRRVVVRGLGGQVGQQRLRGVEGRRAHDERRRGRRRGESRALSGAGSEDIAGNSTTERVRRDRARCRRAVTGAGDELAAPERACRWVEGWAHDPCPARQEAGRRRVDVRHRRREVRRHQRRHVAGIRTGSGAAPSSRPSTPSAGERILDIAAGTGTSSEPWAERGDRGRAGRLLASACCGWVGAAAPTWPSRPPTPCACRSPTRASTS